MLRALLTLLACLYSTTLVAQLNVNVVISGIDKPLEDNIRLFLSIEQQKNHALISEGRLRRLHTKANQEIASALQPFGYYRSVIKAELKKLTNDHWQATYIINPGPPITIGEFNFVISKEMGEDEEFQSLIKNFSLHTDDVFN
ncbi:MAG: outer membrane protein assembly factor, partial [Gammaproteobacteria bacterium]|nr:outer membrane protein assembly factor [Gammaproteobacteria bacterium]